MIMPLILTQRLRSGLGLATHPVHALFQSLYRKGRALTMKHRVAIWACRAKVPLRIGHTLGGNLGQRSQVVETGPLPLVQILCLFTPPFDPEQISVHRGIPLTPQALAGDNPADGALDARLTRIDARGYAGLEPYTARQ